MQPNTDTLRPFLLEEHGIRGLIVQMDATWRAVLERHDYPPPVRDRLGELLTAAALLTATLNYRGTLSLQLHGSGSIGWLWAECTSDYGLRATAHWNETLDGGGAPGKFAATRLTITLDPKEGKQRYQGVVAVEGDNLAVALEDYFNRSEQLATRLWLHADEHVLTGLLLQQLPGAASADPDAWNRAGVLAATVSAAELAQTNATDIIQRLFHEEDVRIYERIPLGFRCTCTRDRVVHTLRMLGPDEIKPLLEEQGEVSVNCEFCNQRYVFDAVDIEQVFADDAVEHRSSTQH